MSKEWIVDGNLGGYIDDNGHFIVCEEYGVSDEQADNHSIDVMNGNGFYDEQGHYLSYKVEL